MLRILTISLDIHARKQEVAKQEKNENWGFIRPSHNGYAHSYAVEPYEPYFFPISFLTITMFSRIALILGWSSGKKICITSNAWLKYDTDLTNSPIL